MFRILENELAEKNVNMKNIKYLICTKVIDTDITDECAFYWSCENGHLCLAKWIWEVSRRETKEIGRETKEINIHIFDEYAFCYACENDHLEVAKWLWVISHKSINIHVDDEYAFRWACINGHLEIVKWLWEVSLGSINLHVYDNYLFNIQHKNVLEWLNS